MDQPPPYTPHPLIASPSPTNPLTTPPPSYTSFTPFSRLPIEIRLIIWRLASETGRIIEIKYREDTKEYYTSPELRIPGVLLACKESHTEALKIYETFSFSPIIPESTRYHAGLGLLDPEERKMMNARKFGTYVNFEHDILYLATPHIQPRLDLEFPVLDTIEALTTGPRHCKLRNIAVRFKDLYEEGPAPDGHPYHAVGRSVVYFISMALIGLTQQPDGAPKKNLMFVVDEEDCCVQNGSWGWKHRKAKSLQAVDLGAKEKTEFHPTEREENLLGTWRREAKQKYYSGPVSADTAMKTFGEDVYPPYPNERFVQPSATWMCMIREVEEKDDGVDVDEQMDEDEQTDVEFFDAMEE